MLRADRRNSSFFIVFTTFVLVGVNQVRGAHCRRASHEFESIKSANQHSIPARYRRFARFGRRSGDCFPCRIALSAGRFRRRGRFFRSFRLSDYKPSDTGDFFVRHSELRTILCTACTTFASGSDHDGFGCLRRRSNHHESADTTQHTKSGTCDGALLE